MHIGNVYAALAAWLGVRSAASSQGTSSVMSGATAAPDDQSLRPDQSVSAGRLLLRIEDIDTPRVRKDADRWIMDDLHWLGLDWDGEPVYQSQRLDLYEQALRQLNDAGLVYPCFCSRADIRAASAPNEGDGFIVYPGTCRRLAAATRNSRLAAGDRHSWRIAMPESLPPSDAGCVNEDVDGDAALTDLTASVAPAADGYRFDHSGNVYFEDCIFGSQHFNLARDLGDVVLRRSDGLFAYQLAVTVDDLDMGVNQIVRGRDLLRSTAVQLWIRRCLLAGRQDSAQSLPQPLQFVHLPLIDDAAGKRLAKRNRSWDLGAMREDGVNPESIIGYCAWLLRLVDTPEPCRPEDLLARFSLTPLIGDSEDKVSDLSQMTAK